MVAYSCLVIGKCKNYGQLSSKFKHNLRVVDVKNADAELLGDNIVLIGDYDDNKNVKNFADSVKDRIENLDYYKDHKIKSNQVLAYEVVIPCPHVDGVDDKDVMNACKEWLEKEFNVAPDGKSNIISLVYHADEAGENHLHAIVTPVDERGHLNASRFTNGARMMRDMQSRLAEALSPYGFIRGQQKSSATHRDIQKLYADIKQVKENIPNPAPGETAKEYQMRIMDELETAYIAKYKEADDYAISKRRQSDASAVRQQNVVEEELELTMKKTEKYREENRDLKRESIRLGEEVDNYRNEIENLVNELFRLQGEEAKEYKKRLEQFKDLEAGLEILAKTEPDRIEDIRDIIDKAIELGANDRKTQEQAL